MEPGELVVCRICLVGDGNLYDIHEWGLDQAFIKLMGLPLADSLPQYLCSWCRALLIKAWRLRARCHRADALLRNMFYRKPVTNSDILTIDRSANELTHTLTQSLSTGVQYHFAHTQSNESCQSAPCSIGKQPFKSDKPSIIIGDEGDEQPFKSDEPSVIIGDEGDEQPFKSDEPSVIIGDESDEQPCNIIGENSDKEMCITIGDMSNNNEIDKQPRRSNRPCNIIGDKNVKTHKKRLQYNGPSIIIGETSDKQPRIIIRDEISKNKIDKKPKKSKQPRNIIADKSDKQPCKSKQPCIVIGEKSDKYPCIIIGDKSDKTDKQPYDSDQPWISEDESDNDEENGITGEFTHCVVDGDEKESDLKASDTNCDVADHMNESDEQIEMNTRVTEAIEYEIEANLASVEKVKKKKVKISETEPKQYCLPTIEECEEHAKKHNFKMQCLTEKEMVEEMERRKMSDRYKNRKFKCNFCHKGFMTKTTFDNHTKKYHNPRNAEYECKLCRVSYPGEFRQQQHMRNSHELRFTCAECGYIVWDKNECIQHATTRHDMRQCKFCDKRFRNGSTIAWHMRAAHSVENAARGSCEICGEIFTGEKGLRTHKLLTHNKADQASPDLQCRRCRLLFDNEEALRKHVELNNGKCDLSMSACTACGADCADADALLRHMRAAHQQLVHTCDVCNKLFLTDTSLSTHIDRVHRGIPPQQPHRQGAPARTKRDKNQVLKPDRMCELCGRVFFCNALLKTHQMTHTGERPFKCTLCPKAYVSAMELRTHRDMHAGIRKYRCKDCPKTYIRQASIYKHRMVHTGERPFECHVCNKTFNQSGSLVAHIKYVHMKVKPPPRRRRGRAAVQSRLRDDA